MLFRSAVARQVVVVQSQALAQGFRDVSGAISGLQTDVDKQVTATANDINALAARIAALNTAIGNAMKRMVVATVTLAFPLGGIIVALADSDGAAPGCRGDRDDGVRAHGRRAATRHPVVIPR